MVYQTTNLSPFEVVYGFQPLTPLNILPLPDSSSLFYKKGIFRAEFVKKFHEKIKERIEKQTKKHVEYNNKRRKEINF